MGRTDMNTVARIKSPVKYYLSFGGESGRFSYWDGTKQVELERVEFIMLDTRSSISGWSESNNARIFSNYFRTTKDEIRIRASNKDILTGTYAADKDKIKEAGGKFQANIFALADINDEWVPVSIQLTGSALAAWTNFLEENKLWNVYKSLVTVQHGEQQKKGRVLFYTPTFNTEPLTDELTAVADDFYKKMLKPYLEQGTPEEV